MIALLRLLLTLLATPFRTKSSLEAENAALRQQMIVLRRKLRGRVKFSNGDRLFFAWLYRLFPSISRVMLIIRPDTLVRWHRAGFRHYWRWKSRGRIGRPRPPRHAGSIAPCWLPLLLALEVARPYRPAARRPGASRFNQTDGRQESIVGCAAHSW